MNQRDFYEEQLKISKQSHDLLVALVLTTQEIYKTKEGERALEELNAKIKQAIKETK